jgi:hypothetical protein
MSASRGSEWINLTTVKGTGIRRVSFEPSKEPAWTSSFSSLFASTVCCTAVDTEDELSTLVRVEVPGFAKRPPNGNGDSLSTEASSQSGNSRIALLFGTSPSFAASSGSTRSADQVGASPGGEAKRQQRTNPEVLRKLSERLQDLSDEDLRVLSELARSDGGVVVTA